MVEGITVVIPTIGRDTLADTLASIYHQLNPEDAVVVVGDGEQPSAQKLVENYARQCPEPDWTYITEYGGCWGHPLRNYAMSHHVETSHVWTIDDDDVATDYALEAMRDHMSDPWTVFKMTFGEAHFAAGITCWRYPKLTLGDIGTPMLFAPLSDARWGASYTGDFQYAKQLLELFGEPVWAEDVVCVVRPREEA